MSCNTGINSQVNDNNRNESTISKESSRTLAKLLTMYNACIELAYLVAITEITQHRKKHKLSLSLRPTALVSR